jgi:hypothetical protein
MSICLDCERDIGGGVPVVYVRLPSVTGVGYADNDQLRYTNEKDSDILAIKDAYNTANSDISLDAIQILNNRVDLAISNNNSYKRDKLRKNCEVLISSNFSERNLRNISGNSSQKVS